MQDIIESFLQFQHEVFPKRYELFKRLATSQNPRTLFIAYSEDGLVGQFVSLADYPHVSAT
ncbi:hypothetical protein [Photorhabdus heterorhabditis]|uniref:Uncharacterized protein n=1 Tax=Photorhabdus heterorhabditis TaxID=880156 RepID=A0A5B0VS78_9GAMM|nr:hypothetical protein [Photorhabdus heterorhabditis]KAA1177334.1 hypothetical protein F0L16_19510 [Photorhabdus heterorhabditis]KOY62061.1 hypothetical protein AM629_10565 [Photorhabdus heterorhabditis]MBS9443449.1 hypothetical protein [Photorhabdus heterorhabditis]